MSQSAAAGGNGIAANRDGDGEGELPVPAAASNAELLFHLRKYLLLLAILAATVTYVAGLNPPGGVWLDTRGGHLTGNQILVVTYHARYNAFSYSNATAFMASCVVILLLLLVFAVKDQDKEEDKWFFALRVVMVLDLLALVVAYAAGASRDMLTTILASVLVSPIFIYVLLHMVMDSKFSMCLLQIPGALCNVSSTDPKQELNKKEPDHSQFFHSSANSGALGDAPSSTPKQELNKKEPGHSQFSHSSANPKAICDAPSSAPKQDLKKKEDGILMLLSIFATTITYTAGLNPPGGFWPDTQDGHRGGDPVLNDHHRRRFMAFFICNTVSFVASLCAIMLLLTDNFGRRIFLSIAKFLPQVFIWISLLGLVVAYATGSCRAKDSTTSVLGTYLVALIILVLVYIARRQRNHEEVKVKDTETKRETLDGLALEENHEEEKVKDTETKRETLDGLALEENHEEEKVEDTETKRRALDGDGLADGLKKARSLLVLLATLVAAVTYQAGLNPPGGFWPDNRDGHKGGDPILLTMNGKRYRLFFYFNSMAFVTSLVVIFMLQRNYLNPMSSKSHRPRVWLWQHQKQVQLVIVMVLDLIALIGAFAAGCCRDVNTSIHVIALAGGTLVYVVFHIVFFTMHMKHEDLHIGDHKAVEKKRKLLLLIIILAVTLTYQAGLTPPGGFWLQDDGELGHRAGDPVLLSNYPRRYAAFFYLNATGFMASVALTILLVNPNLYRAGINCHALFVCMVAGLFGLMGAYAAGSSRHLRTSLFMIVLIGAVFIFVILARLICPGTGTGAAKSNEAGGDTSRKPPGIAASDRSNEAGGDIEDGRKGSSDRTANKEVSPSTSNEAGGNTSNTASAGNIGLETQRKYLTLLGILAASVTYQAGLAPPGGVWPDNIDGHAVGNPILRDSNRRRYHIFFYFNSASFVASVVVITLQLVVVLLTTLKENMRNKANKFLIQAAHGIMVVDLLGLLGAYAAGSSREWETSGYIVALVAGVASYIGIHLTVSFLCLNASSRRQYKTSEADTI